MTDRRSRGNNKNCHNTFQKWQISLVFAVLSGWSFSHHQVYSYISKCTRLQNESVVLQGSSWAAVCNCMNVRHFVNKARACQLIRSLLRLKRVEEYFSQRWVNRNSRMQSNQQAAWSHSSSVHSSHTHADELSAHTHTRQSVVCVKYDHLLHLHSSVQSQMRGSLISFLFLSVALSQLWQAKYLPVLGDIPGHSPHSLRPGTSRNWKSTLSVFLLNEDIRGCQYLRITLS